MGKPPKKLTALALALGITMLLATGTVPSLTIGEKGKETVFAFTSSKLINVGGDVSLTEQENRIVWNPHVVGLTGASHWKTTFNNETQITLQTTADEAGHVAAGAWWTTSFKSNSKIQLHTSEPIRIVASFRVKILTASYESNSAWLRMALACAVQRSDDSVVYTEMDFWDSPKALQHPSGNIKEGGDIVYKGGDVVEYKIDQAAMGKWINYSLDLTHFTDRAWSLKSGDSLESVYIVVETMGAAVDVSLIVDDFWITLFE